MREIKFRAWDKAGGQMSKPFTLSDLTQYEHIFEVMFKNLAQFNNLIWLEYIGLKDKNGKEIYEGDLVRLKGNAFVNHEVYWDERSFQYRLCATHIKDKQFDKTHLLDFAKTGEIIGNIYENPELLKED